MHFSELKGRGWPFLCISRLNYSCCFFACVGAYIAFSEARLHEKSPTKTEWTGQPLSLSLSGEMQGNILLHGLKATFDAALPALEAQESLRLCADESNLDTPLCCQILCFNPREMLRASHCPQEPSEGLRLLV